MKKNFTFLCHIYYENGWEILKHYFDKIIFSKYNLLINICTDNADKFKIFNAIKKDFKDAIVIFTTNKGKDIGGKLALIDLCIRLNLKTDYFIFLHDKKSPHTTLGTSWRDKLFIIIEHRNIELILDLFEKNVKMGIVSASQFITNEYNELTDSFDTTSNSILKKVIPSYNLNLTSYDFVGGTMFWIRSEIITSFFERNNPLTIRATLENGNVLDHEYGTNTHAWERVLSWLANNNGYYIKGI